MDKSVNPNDRNNSSFDSAEKNKNFITEGPVWKGLLSFFFPILFGTVFQQLYNTADAIIVGQFAGKESLAAVAGGTAVFVTLLVGFFVGISSGAGVIVSQFYGAKNEGEVSRASHTALMLALISGAVMSVAGFLISPLAMKLIETPADFYDKSVCYLRIYFAGMIPMFVYNMGSGIFRATGDSKTPLYVLIAGCAANVVFDLLFVVVLKKDVAGAAWATVLCQTLSMILILVKMKRTSQGFRLKFSKLAVTPHLLKKMVQIGIPAGMQSVFYTISNLIIQSDVNSFGTVTAAAWAAYGRIDSIYWMTINAFAIALTTFAGQNYGAGKIARIHQGTKNGMFMGGAIALSVTFFFMLFGKAFFRLFTADSEVIQTGLGMMRFLSPFFVVYMPVELLAAVIRGTGCTFIPTVITCFGVCVLRLFWLIFIFPLNRTMLMAFACYPMTWTVTAVIFIIYYRCGKWLKDYTKSSFL